MTDSKALREHIRQSGVKMYALAGKIGVSSYSLQKKIDGVVEFKASEIAKLASVLQLSGDTVNRIFFGSESDLKSQNE